MAAKNRNAVSKFYKVLVTTFGVKAAMCIIILLCALVLYSFISLGFHTNKFIGSNTTYLDLHSIGELATQAGYYTNVEVIEESKKVWKVTLPFTSSKYIFSYDGVIKAGIDFAQVDWHVNELTHTITVNLPESRILSNEIDTNSLYVYDESRSVFSPLTIENVNESLNAMRQKSEEKAIFNGILDEATHNAKTLIKGFLSGSFSNYEIIFE